jgi:HD-GYP domain-containing protein (c-di-GMP phosphodiesterase class II)
LPDALRRYVLTVSVLGPSLALGVAALGAPEITAHDLLWCALLLPLAAIAECFPLHLTHKTNLNVGTAVYMAMILLLPPAIPGMIALLGAIAAHLWRRSEPVEAIFNIAQTGLYVTAAALTFGAVEQLQLGPRVGVLGSLGAILAASVVMHLVNTLLVTLAGALQLTVNPLRVWWVNLGLDLLPHLTLSALGAMAAQVAAHQPWILPVLVSPAFLVHHAVRQTTRLRGDTHEALASLVEVIELRDPYTAGHSRRVAALSRIIALRLRLTEQEADLIEQAGRVHDIGKAGVDSHLLTKPGRLTDDEWTQMRLHPTHGANVIARFAAYQNIVPLVRHHHESWDGSGYPDGLAADEIPFGARIIAVTDAFDALTTGRPYRAALSVDQALAVLRADAGQQWDPRVVDAMGDYLVETRGAVPSYRPATTELPLPREPLAVPRGAAVPTGAPSFGGQ